MNQFPNLLILVLTAGLALLQSTAEAQGNPVPGLLDLGEGVRLELVPLRAGAFLQGSPSTEKDRTDDETRRTVRITHDFSIGKHPVTRRQFERFVEETRYRTEAEKGTSGGFGWSGHELQQQRRFQWRDPGFQQTGEHPVTLVTWNDAQEFNRWLSRRTGLNVQLPTEAEWEYAARAGTQTAYSYGDDDSKIGDYAWFAGNSEELAKPVGKKKPNPWGLHDMHGNVLEWCLDHYDAETYTKQAALGKLLVNPLVIPSERRFSHVARGGSWADKPEALRSASRRGSDKTWIKLDPQRPQSIWWLTSAEFVGFRVVRPAVELPELEDIRSKVTKQSGN
jgi:formylglycine-generating enzyme required for sulfatase activity